MRCPDCSKMVSYSDDYQEPEVELDDLEDGQLTGRVRIALTCAECGTELKETNFEIDEEMLDEDEVKKHQGEGHSLEVVQGNCEMTDKRETTTTKTLKDGTVKTVPIAPRSQKVYYGYLLEVQVRCECQDKGDDALVSRSLTDDIQASNMDELA